MRSLASFVALLLLAAPGLARAQAAAPAKPPVNVATPAPPPPVKNPESQLKLELFNGPDGRFSIMMPGQPTFATQAVPVKNSTQTVPLNQFFVETESNNISYMLMYTDYPPNLANSPVPDLLQRFEDGSLAGKTLINHYAITLGTVPGRAFTCKDSDGYLYDVHDFFVNKRLYQLIVVSNANYTPTFRDGFMNSFHIN